MIEPENEIEPIIIPATIVARLSVLPAFASYSIKPIRAAHAPPIPLNKETNSGILVISTRLAVSQPPIVPIAIPPKIQINLVLNPSP